MVMMVYGQEVPCVRAEKGADFVRAYDENGVCVFEAAKVTDFSGYMLTGGEWDKTSKLKELSNICNQVITAGMDVETTEGTEHFSLEETDQINLSTALSAVEQGAKGYPYHADKKLCRMFTATEIQAIAQAATAHKLYNTTLCNHLLTMVRQATTAEELDAITYSFDSLTAELQENMNKIITAASSL